VIYCSIETPLYSHDLGAKTEQKTPVKHLTDIVVSRLSTPGTYFDETTPAFAIRVGKNRKTWFVIRGRERERTDIGQYPCILAKYLQKMRDVIDNKWEPFLQP
jgi:hypothetical protein